MIQGGVKMGADLVAKEAHRDRSNRLSLRVKPVHRRICLQQKFEILFNGYVVARCHIHASPRMLRCLQTFVMAFPTKIAVKPRLEHVDFPTQLRGDSAFGTRQRPLS